VVLLPPFPFDRRVWAEATVPALTAAGFRAIAIDYPGFGADAGAGAVPPDLSIAAIADRTAGLLHQLGVSRAVVLGMPMGGYVALAFAARFPERLARLILADTRATPDGAAALAGRAQALETLAARGVDAYLASSLPRLLAPDGLLVLESSGREDAPAIDGLEVRTSRKYGAARLTLFIR